MTSSRDRRRPTGMLSATETAAAAGITHARLHRLIEAGHITPAVTEGRGPGHFRWFTADQTDVLRTVAARIDWGMTAAAAVRPVDPPLPAPIHGTVPCNTTGA